MKLILAITQEKDSGRLIDALVSREYQATMLASTGLCYKTTLTHPFSKKCLGKGIIDLVRTCVAEIFSLEIYLSTP